MNLGQMFLVMLALIMLSTFLLSLYTNLMGQMDISVRNLYFSQAVKIAENEFQKYEAWIIGQVLTFYQVYDTLRSGIDLEPVNIEGTAYHVNISSHLTNSIGINVFTPTSDYQRIDVRVRIVSGNREFYVGENHSALSMVLSRLELEPL